MCLPSKQINRNCVKDETCSPIARNSSEGYHQPECNKISRQSRSDGSIHHKSYCKSLEEVEVQEEQPLFRMMAAQRDVRKAKHSCLITLNKPQMPATRTFID